MATLLSRIFRNKTRNSEPPDQTLEVVSEHSLRNETVGASSQVGGSTAPSLPPTEDKISGSWSMAQVLSVYPAAQRALFQRYHVGGCSSCGFQPSDSLEDVCVNHGLEVEEVTEFIEASQEVERQLEVTPQTASEMLERGEAKILDVRTPEEYAISRIADSVLLNPDLAREIIETWPKDTAIVTVCHHGIRSLDAAAYLKGHGFEGAKSMKGGIDAWSTQIDSSVARY